MRIDLFDYCVENRLSGDKSRSREPSEEAVVVTEDRDGVLELGRWPKGWIWDLF